MKTIGYILMVFLVFLVCVCYLYSIRKLMTKRGIVIAIICGIMWTFTSLIGFLTESNQLHFLKTFVGTIQALFFLLIHTIIFGTISLYLFIKLDGSSKEMIIDHKIIFLNQRNFYKTVGTIALCWLPYCIMHFPARLGGGSTNQIAQFYGQETFARKLSPIIYENHFITNHHPVLLTYLYGMFFKVGNIMGNTNAFAFLLSCIILLINSFCMAYLLKTVKKYISIKLYAAVLLIICFHPIFGIYSYTICKDNLFASALIIFYALILELSLKDDKDSICNKHFKRKLLAVSILIPFLKNQGFLIVIISLVFIAKKIEKIRRFAIMGIGIIIFTYIILFSKILMPALKIAPGGKQEMLSVPFQQTALYVQKYRDELEQKEYEIIDAVLPVDIIAEIYVADKADAVKFKYKQDATRKELLNYFLLWIKLFFKHPDVYFKAFFALTDGYYYIGYGKAELDLYMDVGYGASTPQWVLNFEEKEMALWQFLIHMPIIGVFFRVAIFTWITFFSFFYCIYRKEKKCLLVFTPIILNLVVCILGPWNGIIRYALPIIYALPVTVCLLGKKEVNDKSIEVNHGI